MVWPEKKIQLVASSAAPGIDGVRAVLNGIPLKFFETENLSEGSRENWWEKPFAHKANTQGASPATDLVYWSEGKDDNIWREKVLLEGLNQQSIELFIHNILADEVILKVSESTVLIKGLPLLGHILQEAGFEPTILWPTTNGEWQCERKAGRHWVIPESWQVSAGEVRGVKIEACTTDFEPRASNLEPRSAIWVVSKNGIDFYQGKDGWKFVGQIPRWPEPMEEHVAAETIARCIDLGVSWLDIRLALNSVWDNILTDNLRWKFNDIGWNAWASGEELPSAPINHLEDWWAR